jgi:exodeoxyribonuclease V alpha subunit
VESETVLESIAQLKESQRLITQTLVGIQVVYLPELYDAECYCAQRLTQFARDTHGVPRKLDGMLRKAAQSSGISYSARQEEAIRQAAGNGLLLVTGGPGTGKTTILNGILDLFDQMEVSCVLAAPTGFASVVQMKERLMDSDLTSIIVRGKKGGVQATAALVNAILREIAENPNN